MHVIFERNSASDRNKGFYFEEKYNFTTHKIHGLKVGCEGFISSGVKKHLEYTGSKKAEAIMADLDGFIPRFKKIIPEEYKRVISEGV